MKRFLHSAFCPSIDLHSMGFLYKLRFLRKRKYQEFEQNNWMDYPPDDYYEDLQDHYDDSDSDYYDAQLVQYDDEEDGNHDEDNDEENDAYIIRPDKSKKVYKSIVLRNGLTVLLISDSSAMSSTAAMTVRFGSINDPPDMMGIAHLIEHMLSRGSTENDIWNTRVSLLRSVRQIFRLV